MSLFVTVDNQRLHSKEDAEYFKQYLENGMSWLQQHGKFPSVQTKQEVLDAFKKGVDEFMKLAK